MRDSVRDDNVTFINHNPLFLVRTAHTTLASRVCVCADRGCVAQDRTAEVLTRGPPGVAQGPAA